MGDFERYNFRFAWQSGVGQAVRLIDDLDLQPGVVLDLGCGFGASAEELERRGYTYVGCDIDKAGLEDLRARGFEAHELDLADPDDLPGRIGEVVGDRPLTGVLLLDVLSQLTQPRLALDAAWEVTAGTTGAALVVVVPNIAHADVAAKLVFGRFDYTDTGLLDERNLTFFDHRRLDELTHAAGFREVGRRDFEMPLSDQRFPVTHPALSELTPVGQHLRHLRNLADPWGFTEELVRAYLPVQRADRPAGASAPEATPAPSGRFLTVVMRTQLRRPDNLREALTCLAAQIDDDFDVSLMVHHQDPTVAEQVAEIVREFHSTFSDRVSVIPVLTGGRSRPLNEALDRLRADYVAFLDDDDLVTADWVSTFREGADGSRIARAWTAERDITEVDGITPYDITGELELRWAVPFDLSQHLWQNHSPICSWAVPRALIEAANLRFSEQVDVVEDWHFLIRCAALGGVHDVPRVTSIYHRWVQGESSTSLHREETWRATQHLLLDQLDRDPLLLPKGSASALANLWESHHLDNHASSSEFESLKHELEAMKRSRWWRITRPPAKLFSKVRPLVAWVRIFRRGRNDAAG